MDQDSLIEGMQGICQHRTKNGGRTPHKPLLLLYVLGKLMTEKENVRFTLEEIEPKIAEMLNRYYTSKDKQKPKYPFIYLNNDSIGWKLVDSNGNRIMDTKKELSKGELTQRRITAGFDEETAKLLLNQSSLILHIAYYLLKKNFTERYFSAICDEVGLPVPLPEFIVEAGESLGSEIHSNLRKRDPKFRERILDAYSCKCAFCGSVVQFRGTVVDLEAAHIRWHCHDGPDETSNGLALCSSHHNMFDWGVIGLDPVSDEIYRVQLASQLELSGPVVQSLKEIKGTTILIRQEAGDSPTKEHVNWHLAEVFERTSIPEDINDIKTLF